METKNFAFNYVNPYAKSGISQALKECNDDEKTPVLICVGSDLVLGDSLGPLVGTLLKKKSVSSYIYGTLNYPITAKEIEYVKTYIDGMHPNTISIAIDAAVGNDEDVGLIKVINKGLKPGLGVNKKLDTIGKISIVGVVASKANDNYNLFNLTRLNLIYKMAECIADGIEKYIEDFNKPSVLSNLINNAKTLGA